MEKYDIQYQSLTIPPDHSILIKDLITKEKSKKHKRTYIYIYVGGGCVLTIN